MKSACDLFNTVTLYEPFTLGSLDAFLLTLFLFYFPSFTRHLMPLCLFENKHERESSGYTPTLEKIAGQLWMQLVYEADKVSRQPLHLITAQGHPSIVSLSSFYFLFYSQKKKRQSENERG